MPLIFAPCGKLLKVVKILTDERTKKHLENLGITIGSAITMISGSGKSAICIVKDSRLALDGALATKIFVVQQQEAV